MCLECVVRAPLVHERVHRPTLALHRCASCVSRVAFVVVLYMRAHIVTAGGANDLKQGRRPQRWAGRTPVGLTTTTAVFHGCCHPTRATERRPVQPMWATRWPRCLWANGGSEQTLCVQWARCRAGGRRRVDAAKGRCHCTGSAAGGHRWRGCRRAVWITKLAQGATACRRPGAVTRPGLLHPLQECHGRGVCSTLRPRPCFLGV